MHPLGLALAKAYETGLPALEVDVQESPGSVGNVESLQRGDADLAFAYADVAYLAFVGRLEGEPAPFDRLRGIAVLQLATTHLVIRADRGIRRVEDLRGRRVGIGQHGSSTELTAFFVLRAFGMDSRSVQTEALVFNQAATSLIEGRLDAFFVTASYPAESVRMSTLAGAQLLALVGPAINRLRDEYPFLRPALIPRGTYPGQSQPVQTVGVDDLLICRSGLEEPLVYDLTKRFFEVLPSLTASQQSLRLMDLERAPATPIPLHDGAARYYRERELSK
jgi:uncharacterized protein